ncbi:MAG: phosphoribosylformylglycinamidine cyclo-ligase [Peptococcaceae bacterium]|nr:phosphoribosylformylglycinamidine cyclo-ligase [Peptococcaceae bacterium]
MGMTYEDAGVNVSVGNSAVERIKPAVARTRRPEVLGGLGGFGGLFALDVNKYPDPVLVSGTDGVGTKLRLAFQMDRHDTIGIDAVAMCVNDILVSGAEPLFYLDYVATSRIDPDKMAAVVGGIAAGCEMAGCALIGGEMAEMPGFYHPDEYDIAGFAVGVVNRECLIDNAEIRPGDVLIGLPSSGVHSNGFSLVRKIFEEYAWDVRLPGLEEPLGDVLLAPTRIYVTPVLELLAQGRMMGIRIPGMVHITGGGFTENLPRVLPEGYGVEIRKGSWDVPPIFGLMQEIGGIEESEMFRTFNMGIGFVIVTHEEDEKWVVEVLRKHGEQPVCVGSVVEGAGRCATCNIKE